ncbi:MAG: hydroxyethylthiazole kinase [Selenomonadaceae bacterium]|nr:hydroxyethylthiazole kinase [Selenomonadaceae bacterium]
MNMTEEEIRSAIAKAVEQVRAEKPLVPSITNTVTQDFVANAQLATGGAAAMLYLADECESVAKVAPAFYINMGTAMPFYEETLPQTARALFANKKPWVLDPVGIGLSELRTKILTQLKVYNPAIVRGNASEIIALAKLWQLINEAGGNVHGVESTEKVSAAKGAALAIAKFTGGAVAVSGEEDLVTDGKDVINCAGGSELFTKITGSGCALGGVMAVYAAVTTPFIAALTATTMFNLAGSKAAAQVEAPASFKVAFLDSLYELTAEEVANNFRVVGSFENMFNFGMGD